MEEHKLALIFGAGNLATDENMPILNVMKKVALRRSLVCPLHEKSFVAVMKAAALSGRAGKRLLRAGMPGGGDSACAGKSAENDCGQPGLANAGI